MTLLEAITCDLDGRALEFFMAWHHPSTVFDLDARVGRMECTARAREFVDELRALLL